MRRLSLIGHGLDAVIQSDVERMPPEITAAMRMQRYEVARLHHSNGHSRRCADLDDLRLQLGRNYQACWRAGKTPNLRGLPAHTRSIEETLACLPS